LERAFSKLRGKSRRERRRSKGAKNASRLGRKNQRIAYRGRIPSSFTLLLCLPIRWLGCRVKVIMPGKEHRQYYSTFRFTTTCDTVPRTSSKHKVQLAYRMGQAPDSHASAVSRSESSPFSNSWRMAGSNGFIDAFRASYSSLVHASYGAS
jgi:hypothetical protein